MNKPYQHARPKTLPTFNRQQHNRRAKNPFDHNGIQLWWYLWKYISYGPELPRKTWFILYTRSFSFSIRFWPLWTDQKLSIWVLKCSSSRQWRYEQICRKRMVQLLYEQFETRKQKIRRHKGTKIYRFENGNLVTTIENVGIPIVMGK